MHLNALLKSTSLLEALPTDLAVEAGALPGPVAIHTSGLWHLPRQVLLALKFFLADSAGEHDVTVYLARMHLQLHLALECFSTLITASLYLIWSLRDRLVQ